MKIYGLTRVHGVGCVAVSMICAGALGPVPLSATMDEAVAAKAKPKVSLVKQRPVRVVPIEINRFAYTTRVEAKCRGKATPLMLGWSSPGGTIGSAAPATVGAETSLGMSLVAPAREGQFRATLGCLNRHLFTQIRKGKAPGANGVSRVSCSRRQVAVGMPVNNAPYYTKNVFSRPVGSRGWESNDGHLGRAVVLCVAKRSMRAVKTVSRSVAFDEGATTAEASASCKGGRVPISWGFESDLMPENEAKGYTQWVSAPLISDSRPKGRNGWSLTFFTPDGKPAVKSGRVAVHLTCAKPR